MLSIAVWMFLISLLSPIDACSCKRDNSTLAEKLCKYDLVIRALALPGNAESTTVMGSSPTWKNFKIKTIKVYKNTKNVPELSVVTTDVPRGFCGYSLQEDKAYLLLPSDSGHITRCDPNQVWQNLPADISEGLENGKLMEICNMPSSVMDRITSGQPTYYRAHPSHLCVLLLLSCQLMLANANNM